MKTSFHLYIYLIINRINIMKINALMLFSTMALSTHVFAGGYIATDIPVVKKTIMAPAAGQAAGLTNATNSAVGTTTAVVIGGAAIIAAIALAASDSDNSNVVSTSTTTSKAI